MVWTRRLVAAVLVAAALLALVLAGCEKSLGERVANLAPETTLSFSPDDGDTANYRVRMNWFGWDPDGEISYFLTKWDTLDWVRVVNTDSVFLVSASGDTVDEQNGFEYHTFSVKAVDNEGMEDASPEVVSFTAFTSVPETQFLQVGGGPTGTTGPMVSFRWQATDQDGVIVGYDYRLSRWDAIDHEWDQVLPDPLVAEWIEVGPDISTASFGPLAGRHLFEVRAIDDAGAADQTPARREFTCNPALAGPRLYVGSNVFGLFQFRGPVWPESANDAIPIFAGERLRFNWEATGQDYGGQILGYRHAYDDTSTWPAWSIFDTHFEVAPDLGGHSLYVSALDNSNVQTRGRIRFEVVEATLDEYILVVDDWDEREHLAAWGTDEDRTSFYDLLLAGYVRDRVEWEPSQHLENGVPQAPGVDALRGASTVIWYADNENITLAPLFDPFQTQYNALAGYVRVGGNLVLCGRRVLTQVLDDEPYPITVSADDTTQAVGFVRDFLHIGYADNSGSAVNKNSPWSYGYCFYGANPAPGWEDEFSSVYIDSVGTQGYPDPGKWPVYSWQSPPYPAGYVRGGLHQIDKLQAFQGTGEEIFLIDAYLNELNYGGEPCAVLYLSGDNHGNSCFFGFPLYYCQYSHVKAMLDKVLLFYGEEKIQ
jgi:hypothetical protein